MKGEVLKFQLVAVSPCTAIPLVYYLPLPNIFKSLQTSPTHIT